MGGASFDSFYCAIDYEEDYVLFAVGQRPDGGVSKDIAQTVARMKRLRSSIIEISNWK